MFKLCSLGVGYPDPSQRMEEVLTFQKKGQLFDVCLQTSQRAFTIPRSETDSSLKPLRDPRRPVVLLIGKADLSLPRSNRTWAKGSSPEPASLFPGSSKWSAQSQSTPIGKPPRRTGSMRNPREGSCGLPKSPDVLYQHLAAPPNVLQMSPTQNPVLTWSTQNHVKS